MSEFLESNRDMQEVFEDFGRSRFYLWMKNYAEGWGWHVPEYNGDAVKAHLVGAIMSLGTQAQLFFGNIYNILNNLAMLMWSFGTFFTFLLYFLQQEDLFDRVKGE